MRHVIGKGAFRLTGLGAGPILVSFSAAGHGRTTRRLELPWQGDLEVALPPAAELRGRVLEAGTPGETYNVGGNSERTNLEVVETLCRLLDEAVPDSTHRPHRDLVTFVPDRPGHDRRYAVDFTRATGTFGWRPQHRHLPAGRAEGPDHTQQPGR